MRIERGTMRSAEKSFRMPLSYNPVNTCLISLSLYIYIYIYLYLYLYIPLYFSLSLSTYLFLSPFSFLHLFSFMLFFNSPSHLQYLNNFFRNKLSKPILSLQTIRERTCINHEWKRSMSNEESRHQERADGRQFKGRKTVHSCIAHSYM